MGSKLKKITISEFISDKKLNKIYEIIKKSDDVETNYDRIEILLDDDFIVKDLGTNRIVFIHKKNKFKDLIFKVAGDEHGIEANYREFYNGDLDKRLTYSYSISNNGVFVVQEKVTRMTKDMMKEYKKDVREMLHKLSKKILLVDCRLTNFKNFGIRKNGKVCLLDHGDTVPLPKYQDDNIVNVNEESFVSLRCKKPIQIGERKFKPCNGKLQYSKDFDYLVCDKCNGVTVINDAYREFYGDKKIHIKGGAGLNLVETFDPDEWKEHIRKYCQDTMSKVDINNEKGEKTMKTKIINGKKCIQVKGFWLPEPDNGALMMIYNAVRMGQSKPHTYIEKLGLNIDDYKVMPTDHIPSENINEIKVEQDQRIIDIANAVILGAKSMGEFENIVKYESISDLLDENDIDTIRQVREIVAKSPICAGCIYTKEGFSVRIKPKFLNNTDMNIVKESSSNFFVAKEIDNHSDNESINNTGYVSENTISNEDTFNFDELIEEYTTKSSSHHVHDDVVEEEYSEKRGIEISNDYIKNETIIFNDTECIVINKYAVPVNIIKLYETDDGSYQLPTTKMKNLLKSHNLHPKKFKINVDENSSDSDIDESTEDISVFAPDINEEDNKFFINKFKNLIDQIINSEETNNIIMNGNKSFLRIPVEDIIANCLILDDYKTKDIEIYADIHPLSEDNNEQIGNLPEDNEYIAINLNENSTNLIYSLLTVFDNAIKSLIYADELKNEIVVEISRHTSDVDENHIICEHCNTEFVIEDLDSDIVCPYCGNYCYGYDESDNDNEEAEILEDQTFLVNEDDDDLPNNEILSKNLDNNINNDNKNQEVDDVKSEASIFMEVEEHYPSQYELLSNITKLVQENNKMLQESNELLKKNIENRLSEPNSIDETNNLSTSNNSKEVAFDKNEPILVYEVVGDMSDKLMLKFNLDDLKNITFVIDNSNGRMICLDVFNVLSKAIESSEDDWMNVDTVQTSKI